MRSIRRLALSSSSSATAMTVDRDWGLRIWLKQPILDVRRRCENALLGVAERAQSEPTDTDDTLLISPQAFKWLREADPAMKRLRARQAEIHKLRLAIADNPRRQGSSGRVPSPGLTGVEGS